MSKFKFFQKDDIRYETYTERLLRYFNGLFSVYDERFGGTNRPDGLSNEQLESIYEGIKNRIIMGGIVRYQQVRFVTMTHFEGYTNHRFGITEDTHVNLIHIAERE